MVQGEDSVAGPGGVAGQGAAGELADAEMTAGSPLRTPKAAAWAGIAFAVLAITAMVLIRLSIPEQHRPDRGLAVRLEQAPGRRAWR